MTTNGGSLAWLSLFSVFFILFALPPFAPTVPGSDLRLVWLPGALLGLAFLIRPQSQWIAYAAIYGAVSLAVERHFADLGFDFGVVLIEVLQAWGIALFVRAHVAMDRVIDRPSVLLRYAAIVTAICALGGLLMLFVADRLVLPSAALDLELAGNPATAWRHWWLGNSFNYLTIATAGWILAQKSWSEWSKLLASSSERRQFALLTLGLVIVTLLVFPTNGGLGKIIPFELRLAPTVLLVPLVFALSAQFFGLGAAVAILIVAPIASLSMNRPELGDYWGEIPQMSAFIQAYLIALTATSYMIAANARQLRIRAAEAKAAKVAKANFIDVMNHELRTPLNAIIGYSEFECEFGSRRDPRDVEKSIRHIHSSGLRLLSVIESVLEHGDRGGVFELSKVPIDLTGALEEAVAEIRPLFQVRERPVEFSVPERLSIHADPLALKRLLLAVLSYGVRYMGSDTCLEIAAGESGADTWIEIGAYGLLRPQQDFRDEVEMSMANAFALAHGARINVTRPDSLSRVVRVTFFATRAVA